METDTNTVDPDNTIVSDQQNKTFQSLTPGSKYKLVKEITTPQNTSYNKDGTISIQVNRHEANQLLQITEISSIKVSITKHPHRNNIRGVISNDIIRQSPVEEIQEGLVSENCVHVRKEMQPKRDRDDKILRDKENKVILEPTKKAIITLESENLPREVSLFGVSIPVTQFEPEPFQCKRCYKFGQCQKYTNGKRENNCRLTESEELCGWCGEPKHKENREKCTNNAKCQNCMGEHSSWNKRCPVYIREKETLKIKEIQKVPYPKAKAILEQRMNPELRTDLTNVVSAEMMPTGDHHTKLQAMKEKTDHYENFVEKQRKQHEKDIENINQQLAQVNNVLAQLLAYIKPAIPTIEKTYPDAGEKIKSIVESVVTSLPKSPPYESRSYGNLNLESREMTVATTSRKKPNEDEIKTNSKHQTSLMHKPKLTFDPDPKRQRRENTERNKEEQNLGNDTTPNG